MNHPMSPAVMPSVDEPNRDERVADERSNGAEEGGIPVTSASLALEQPAVPQVVVWESMDEGMPVAVERETLTWDDFGGATRGLARGIVADGFAPDIVVAIARGGLLPAGAIAYGLGVKSCGALNVEFYTGIGTVLDAPEILPPDLDLSALPGKRVLLVDDVADSGRTLALAVQLLSDAGADVRSVCIYTKPGSIAMPDYSWRETDRWIDFPWSFRGTVVQEDAGLPAGA